MLSVVAEGSQTTDSPNVADHASLPLKSSENWCSTVMCSLLGFGSSLLDNFNSFSGDFDKLTHGKSSSLSVNHDWETVHIVHVWANSGTLELCKLRWGLPFGFKTKLLYGFFEGSTSCASKDWYFEFGQCESSQWVDNSGEVSAIDKDLLSVNDVNNDAKFAVVGAIIDKANSAGFNEGSVDLKLN
jgi:hypothetical protein